MLSKTRIITSQILYPAKRGVDICPNRMIVVVGQSHIHQNLKRIAVDTCPPNSSICLVNSYPNSMCVCVWARTRPNSFVLMVGIHPDSMVAINGWGWQILWWLLFFSFFNNVGQLLTERGYPERFGLLEPPAQNPGCCCVVG